MSSNRPLSPKRFRMASCFLRRLVSLFHQQRTKEKATGSISMNDGVFGDLATSVVYDIPPPYHDLAEEKAPILEEKYPASAPSTASPNLRICPHQAVSFDGLKKNYTSTAIKNTCKNIDALDLRCQEHLRQSSPAAGDTKGICISPRCFLRGFGSFSHKNAGLSGRTPELVLSFDWDIGSLDGIRCQVETAAELQQFLSMDDIWLCPHKRICDSDIVNALYGFLNRNSGHGISTSCDCCETKITIVATKEGNDETCCVTTKRFLGTMEKPDDPVWLAQCGVWDGILNRERSMPCEENFVSTIQYENSKASGSRAPRKTCHLEPLSFGATLNSLHQWLQAGWRWDQSPSVATRSWR